MFKNDQRKKKFTYKKESRKNYFFLKQSVDNRAQREHVHKEQLLPGGKIIGTRYLKRKRHIRDEREKEKRVTKRSSTVKYRKH